MAQQTNSMYDLAVELFPICRSITGEGVRETLRIIRKRVPELELVEVPSGQKVYDWQVPAEWQIRQAHIEDQEGNKILDFNKNNLHVVSYSEPVDQTVNLEELLKHIYTDELRPNAIPYVTAYYKKSFGFCMSQKQRDTLKPGHYHMVIDSSFLENGSLTYGEVLLRGESEKEIFFSTNICHPSMANNELSGPCVAVELIKWLKKRKLKYTYRFVFLPETIGSITYLSRNYQKLKENIIAGYTLSCVGDERCYSYIATRYGNTLADKVLKAILEETDHNCIQYSYLQRSSDERQYNAPGIDLPVCGFSRSKCGEFPEYHTSDDDLSLITPKGLSESLTILQNCVRVLELNDYYKVNCLCEPQLGKRGLYPTVSKRFSYGEKVKALTNTIAYMDGTNDLIDISEIIAYPLMELLPVVEKLRAAGLISISAC